MDKLTFFSQCLSLLGDQEFVMDSPAARACELWFPSVMGVIKMMKSAEFQARLNNQIDVEILSRLKDDSSYTLAEAALAWGMNSRPASSISPP